ncbi:hypothetical protein [Chloracidobacterium aggregatum]|uniref:hypothetical protein n=1 Tax=Chloracidobacterium aggregatum TaxID=2851959 RepID=UPI001B8C87B8|nr:hypothetical protein [Chloracidobacterium aggregatum]QUV86259.1 hypothetical protein J8C03_15920 [Chloracidobacterium sp. 2]
METNTRANGGQGVYDDRIVTLRKLPNGQFQVTELRANTEPGSQYEDGWSGRTRRPMGVDSNRDGRLDLGGWWMARTNICAPMSAPTSARPNPTGTTS